MPKPTTEAYTELQRAYDFFNTALFGGQLPPCLITLQRHHRTYGYFWGDRWAHHSGTITDEIALNPQHFVSRSTADVLSTLAHEMVHLWQHHCGKPSRNSYHNRQWADKMDAIGLCPSDTGKPEGHRTGQRVSHSIVDGGPFAQACAKLLARGFTLSWHDRARIGAGGTTRTNTRTKYTCPGCRVNAWAKPHIVLVCGACQVALQGLNVAKGDCPAK